MSSSQLKRTAQNYSLKKMEVIHSDRVLWDDSLLSTEGTLDSALSSHENRLKLKKTVSVQARSEEDNCAEKERLSIKEMNKKSKCLNQFSPFMRQLQRKEEETNLAMILYKKLKSCFGSSN